MKISARYEVLGLLGQGGMGVVYHVRDTTRGRENALKTLAPGRSDDIVERFLTEAQVMFRLEHGNIVRVFDFGKDGETYFLTMELIRGKNLRQLLNARQNKGFPLGEVVRMGVETADALAYAHSQKPEAVVHRDIKPVNIMVEEATGRVVVTDFGIAKLMADAGETQASDLSRTVFAGTVPYSAPEQFQPVGSGRRLDARVDIYALGMVLYEIYTGRHFFAGLSAEEVELHHRSLESGTCPVRTPHACDHKVVLPDTPPEFIRAIELAIARDRNERYKTAADMLADLQSCAAAESVQACAAARLAAETAGALDAAATDFRRAGELEREAKSHREQGDHGKAGELFRDAAHAFGAAAAQAGERRLQRAAQQARDAMQIVAGEAHERETQTLAPDAMQAAATLVAAAEASEADKQYEQAAAQFRQAEEAYRAALVSARQASARRAIENELPALRAARESAEQVEAATLAADSFAAAVRDQLRLEEALASGELTRVRELLPRVREGFANATEEAERRLKESVDQARAAMKAAASEAAKAGARERARAALDEAETLAGAAEKIIERGQLELGAAQLRRAAEAYQAAEIAAHRAGQRDVLEGELPAMRAARAEAEGAGAASLAPEAFAAAAREQVRVEEALAAGELTRVRELLPKVEQGFATAKSTAIQAQASRAVADARAEMASARDAARGAGAEQHASDTLATARAYENEAAAAEKSQQWESAEQGYRAAALSYEDARVVALGRAEEQQLAAALATSRATMEAARARADASSAATTAAEAFATATALAERAAAAAPDGPGMTAAAADYRRAAEAFDAAAAAGERARRHDELAATLAAVAEVREQASAAGAAGSPDFAAAEASLAAARRALAADELTQVGPAAGTARERFLAAKTAVERAQAAVAADAALTRIATRSAEAREAGAEDLARNTWSRAAAQQEQALARRREGACEAVLPLAAEAEEAFTAALSEAAAAAQQNASAGRAAAERAGPDDKATAAADKAYAGAEQRLAEGKLVAAAIAFRKAADGYRSACEARAVAAREAEADAKSARRDADAAEAARFATEAHRVAIARMTAAEKALADGRTTEAEAAFAEAAQALRATAATAVQERQRAGCAALRAEADSARGRAEDAGAAALASAELTRGTEALAAGDRALAGADYAGSEAAFRKAADAFTKARETAVRAAAERDARTARENAERVRATRVGGATGFFGRRRLGKADGCVARGTAAAASGDFAAAKTAFVEAAQLFEAMPTAPVAPPAVPAPAPKPAPATAPTRARAAAPSESTTVLESPTVLEAATLLESTTISDAPTTLERSATVARSAATPGARRVPMWIGAAAAGVVLIAGVWIVRGRVSGPTTVAKEPTITTKSDVVPKPKADVAPAVEPKNVTTRQEPEPPVATELPKIATREEPPPPPPPVPRIASVAPEAARVEPTADTQSFRIALADPTGATYAWSVDGKVLDDETKPALTLKAESTPHQVAVAARTAGGEVTHQWQLAALPPPQAPTVPPVISGFEPKEQTLQLAAGKSKRFRVTAKYDGSEPVRYAWSVDGKTVGSNAPSFDFVPEEDGEGGARRVRAEVSAGTAQTARTEWTVNVPLAPVSILRQSPTPTEVVADVGEATDFSVEARAGRNTSAPLSYTWTVNKRPADDASGPRFSYRSERGGNADVEVRVEAPDRPPAVRRWTVRARAEATPAPPRTQVAALPPPRVEPTIVPRISGDPKRELENWIAAYRDAYQQKNVDRLVSLGVVKAENRGKLASALNDLDDLKVSIGASSIDLQGNDAAVVTLTREDSFNAGGRRQSQSINIKKTLRKVNGAWVAQ